MHNHPSTAAVAAEQYRMTLLQVYNWGTFSGLHQIPISREGFLFIGRSGSGKSTLLDALSALLVPPQLRSFNAAAREGDKGKLDRNLALYVRGAWAAQTDSASGEIATQFLRAGTTWSALGLEYQNLQGKTVTLIAIFILRGQSCRAADVQAHYLIADRSFDLKIELSDFDTDIRKLKHKLPYIYHTDKFKPYSEYFRRLLNIDSEMALKLLHKTQSAKNLGDLNLFLREYMLDEPETFTVADRLVSEFAELDIAHQTVVTARQQVEILSRAREQHQALEQQESQRNALDELIAGIDSYRIQQHKKLLQFDINAAEAELSGVSAQEQQEKELLEQQNLQLRRLQIMHLSAGGEQISALKSELQRAEDNKQQRLEKRSFVTDVCKKLGMTLPDNPHAYAALIAQARDANESWLEASAAYEQQRDELRDLYKEQVKEFAQVRQEVESLRQQPSNIPANMLALRKRITEYLGLQETDLPFAGELIEVIEEAAQWRGAIEKVLHSFALSLLVDERHYAAVSKHINETQLGQRLIYYRINQVEDINLASLANQSLIYKLILKPGSYSSWLEAELKRRFNYACVDSLQEFRKTERAITREGQIRHNKTQHEKDDRYNINERRHWILGFDNKEKLKLFEQRAALLAEEIAAVEQKIKVMQEAHGSQLEKAMAFQSIINIGWHEIDAASSLDQVASLQRELARLQQGNARLKQLDEEIAQQQRRVDQQQNSLNELSVKRKTKENELEKNRKELTELNAHPAIPLTPFQQEKLSSYFSNHAKLTLKNIQLIAQQVEREINKDKDALVQVCNESKNAVEKCFQQFKTHWPQDAADLDASIAAAPDFLAKLARIEHDGLPAYEERFFNMLRDQSMENLVALNTYLSQARKDIISRMELVNESLSKVEYNPGTYLEIEVLDRQLEEVKNFRNQAREIINYVLHEDKELAEKNFTILRNMVERLTSQDPADQRWQQQVLDVRQHVEFIAREYDQQRNEVEVHRSGAGKSGGQREKLATTCLAAALCYQLGGQQGGIPLYAPVVLDEAFSKADNEFTQEVMTIFTNFGFQMIVATPLKSVMTLEPFIAGACFVDIAERKYSSTLQILYNTAEKRLALTEMSE